MTLPDNSKRFVLLDDLGYYKSYHSRQRAIQAINEIGYTFNSSFWKLLDQEDKGISFIIPTKYSDTYYKQMGLS